MCANSGKADLNRRPLTPEASALPAALLPVIMFIKKAFQKRKALARAAGLEPAISGVTGQRDNQLRYARVMYSILLKTGACVNRGGRFLLSFLCKILRVLFLDFVFLGVMARKMLVQSFSCTIRILLFKGLQDLFMFLYNSFRIK